MPDYTLRTGIARRIQVRQRLSIALEAVNGLPWKIVIIMDSTLQSRSSLHPENSKKLIDPQRKYFITRTRALSMS